MRFFSLVLVAGCVASGVGENRSAIVGGSTDSGDPNVVLVIIGDPNGGAIGLCTGEVISPHVVLTAGHCTNTSGPYNVFFGNDINRITPSGLQHGTNHPHPQYRGQEDYDIGVIVLDQPAPAGITPLPFNADTDPTGMVGQSVRMVGFGSTGSVDPNDTSAGLKRMVSTTLSAVLSRNLEFDDARHNTCEGDSGGPALGMINGVETIIGLTSVGGENGSVCIGSSLDTRVDLYAASFIQPFIDMYDPPPAPMPGQPGSTGSGCNTDDDCYSKYCYSGYCTASCDPAQAGSCPEGMHCQNEGPNYNLCVYDPKSRAGGCDVSPSPAAPALFLLLLPLAVLMRRRFSN